MFASFSLGVILLVSPITKIPIKFWGIKPAVEDVIDFVPERSQDRAVILVHGLLPRPIQTEKAFIPDPHSWQVPDGKLVLALAETSDVYGVSYAQTTVVDAVAFASGLRRGIQNLKKAGYKEIELVGHSAGGLIVRRFAESFPDSGITKIICIAAPHSGSGWAKIPDFLVPTPQIPFVASLLPEQRVTMDQLLSKPIAKNIQVCCVMCKFGRLSNDTVVALESQWTPDLQKQGIPVVMVKCNHFEAMKSDDVIEQLVPLCNRKLIRWKPEQVEQAIKAIFKN